MAKDPEGRKKEDHFRLICPWCADMPLLRFHLPPPMIPLCPRFSDATCPPLAPGLIFIIFRVIAVCGLLTAPAQVIHLIHEIPYLTGAGSQEGRLPAFLAATGPSIASHTRPCICSLWTGAMSRVIWCLPAFLLTSPCLPYGIGLRAVYLRHGWYSREITSHCVGWTVR